MFVILQYLLFGFALAVPYVFFSGGGTCCLIVGSVLLPIAVLLFSFGQQFRFGSILVLLYVLSPVILNMAAVLLQSVGAMDWASIIHEWRYHSLWVIVVAYLSYDMTSFLIDWRRYRAK